MHKFCILAIYFGMSASNGSPRLSLLALQGLCNPAWPARSGGSKGKGFRRRAHKPARSLGRPPPCPREGQRPLEPLPDQSRTCARSGAGNEEHRSFQHRADGRSGKREFSTRRGPVKKVAAGASAVRPAGRGGTDCLRPGVPYNPSIPRHQQRVNSGIQCLWTAIWDRCYV